MMTTSLFKTILILIRLINAQNTNISILWFDDYVVTSSPATGWYQVDHIGNEYTKITDGDLHRYHGPFVGDDTGATNERYDISRNFYCESKSSVSVGYSIALCGTEPEDYVSFSFNEEVIELTNLTRTKDGGTGYSITDQVLEDDPELDCGGKWEMLDLGPITVPDPVAVNEVFTVKFQIALNFKSDTAGLTDIKLYCGTIPTPEPTVMPSELPTISPSLVPTQSPTTAAPTTGSPTIDPSFVPTNSPTMPPSTNNPTESPTAVPTISPTVPTFAPTEIPTKNPTNMPSVIPTLAPTFSPSTAPTGVPTQPQAPVVESTLTSSTIFTTDTTEETENDSQNGIRISIEMLKGIGWILILGFAAVVCICCVLCILWVRCRRRKRARHSMEMCEPKVLKVGRDIIDINGHINPSPLSVKKSTYSTVSVGDGSGSLLKTHPVNGNSEELYLDTSVPVHEVNSNSFGRNMRNESMAVDGMMDDIVEHMATKGGSMENGAGSFEQHGLQSGNSGGSFQRNLKNEAFAVDQMMDDVVHHMVTRGQ